MTNAIATALLSLALCLGACAIDDDHADAPPLSRPELYVAVAGTPGELVELGTEETVELVVQRGLQGLDMVVVQMRQPDLSEQTVEYACQLTERGDAWQTAGVPVVSVFDDEGELIIFLVLDDVILASEDRDATLACEVTLSSDPTQRIETPSFSVRLGS
ncbi:MAG: hypothetical protein ACJAYU_001932 [Bradymonadia bacterium]|jgi:hypothetical protein